MICVWLGLAAYNVRHQGCLWWYQWRSREEAPTLLVVSVFAYVAASIFMAWLLFQGWHLPGKS